MAVLIVALVMAAVLHPVAQSHAALSAADTHGYHLAAAMDADDAGCNQDQTGQISHPHAAACDLICGIAVPANCPDSPGSLVGQIRIDLPAIHCADSDVHPQLRPPRLIASV